MAAAACGATTRSGGPCKGAAVTGGNGRCRMHNGHGRNSGLTNGRYRSGRYSRNLPPRLAERYDAALADEELLTIRDEVALIEARLSDVLSRVDTGEAGALWKEAGDLYALLSDSDVEKAYAAQRALGDVLLRGRGDWAAWAEVGRLVDQRARLVAAEQARLKTLEQTITAEQAMLLLSAVDDAVRRHVADPDILAAISSELGRLVAVNPVLPSRPALAVKR